MSDTPFSKATRRWTATLLVVATVPAAALAQGPLPDLARASLEDLMKIEITSAARKEQRVGDTAAAVYVLTQDDIRRSGMTTLPDVLRLVPGVQVAQINDNKWAVSVRGFNSLFSNKLLVLIDGRTIYNHLFSGVFWDAEDVLLEDVERIEVIRGPGGALWGANAVNGVINIVTRAAAGTQGTFAQVGSGSADPAAAAVRYGGTAGGAASYRLYSQWASRGASTLPALSSQSDRLDRFTSGGRLDWSTPRDAIVVTGEAVAARARALWLPPTLAVEPDPALVLPTPSDMRGGALLARWVRTRESGASFQLQTTAAMTRRAEPVGAYRQGSADTDFQYHTPVGARNDLVAGAGFRYVDEVLDGRNGYTLVPSHGIDRRFDVFAQDSLALAGDRLTLSAGGRVDRETDVEWSLQPSVRAMWAITPESHRVWAAVARTLRTPSLQDRRIQLDYPAENVGGPLPVATTVSGNPALTPETMVSVDSGYRLSVGVFQFDVAVFRAHYDQLRTNEAGIPHVDLTPAGPIVIVPVQFGSLLQADTSGLELSTRWQPTPSWRVEGAYTAFHAAPHPDPASVDPTLTSFDAIAPSGQWQLHSLWTVDARTEVGLLVQHVGALEQLGVPAYTRADARVEWKLGRGMSVAVTGQNLIDRAHAEFTAPLVQVLATGVPRSVSANLTLRIK